MVTATEQSVVDGTGRLLVVPGGKDITLTPNDFTSWRSWERLCLGMSLRDDDFKDFDMYKRYWYLVHKLTEGCVVVHGKEGNGKSLWMYKTSFELRDLFGKQCTFDIPPKETFGAYRTIDDESFCEELAKFKEIALIEKDVEKGDLPQSRLDEALKDIMLYNATIGIDEAYDKLERARRGNFAINMGRLIRKYRHFHIFVILVSPDMDDIDRRMAFRRRTHEVKCFYNEARGKCSYNIWYKRSNVTTAHELTPSNWAFLWETENKIGSTVLPIRRGG